ncbi:MAG: glycosyltransferase family 1 protein [Bacteroidota bacterium]
MTEVILLIVVTFIVTKGNSALDLYAQELAQKLPCEKIYTDYFEEVSRNSRLSCMVNLAKSVRNDLRIIGQFNKQGTILHFPNQHFGRFGFFLKKPFIITCHDLLKYFDLKRRGAFFQKPTIRGKIYLTIDFTGMKKAKKIIAISEHTKQDLMSYLGIPEEKISVIYQGINHEIFKPPKTLQRKIDSPYILYVGTEGPRKNFQSVLNTFKKIKVKWEFRNLKLVKIGNASSGWSHKKYRSISLNLARSLNLENEVVFTGFLDKEDLASYYAGAECLVFPSFYEGFGFPPLEAMACGCPVVASNISSLPEVVGNAGLLVNPDDHNAIVVAIESILSNENFKNSLKKAGFERAKLFSWQRTAEATLRVHQEIEETLNEK